MVLPCTTLLCTLVLLATTSADPEAQPAPEGPSDDASFQKALTDERNERRAAMIDYDKQLASLRSEWQAVKEAQETIVRETEEIKNLMKDVAAKLAMKEAQEAIVRETEEIKYEASDLVARLAGGRSLGEAVDTYSLESLDSLDLDSWTSPGSTIATS